MASGRADSGGGEAAPVGTNGKEGGGVGGVQASGGVLWGSSCREVSGPGVRRWGVPAEAARKAGWCPDLH